MRWVFYILPSFLYKIWSSYLACWYETPVYFPGCRTYWLGCMSRENPNVSLSKHTELIGVRWPERQSWTWLCNEYYKKKHPEKRAVISEIYVFAECTSHPEGSSPNRATWKLAFPVRVGSWLVVVTKLAFRFSSSVVKFFWDCFRKFETSLRKCSVIEDWRNVMVLQSCSPADGMLDVSTGRLGVDPFGQKDLLLAVVT